MVSVHQCFISSSTSIGHRQSNKENRQTGFFITHEMARSIRPYGSSYQAFGENTPRKNAHQKNNQ
eukprot:scaffold2446_cov106-Cylindrotheca_fusiformis.AAC.6